MRGSEVSHGSRAPVKPLSKQIGCRFRTSLQCQKRYPIVVRSKASDGSIQETETKRVHVYGKQWALQVCCGPLLQQCLLHKGRGA